MRNLQETSRNTKANCTSLLIDGAIFFDAPLASCFNLRHLFTLDLQRKSIFLCGHQKLEKVDQPLGSSHKS